MSGSERLSGYLELRKISKGHTEKPLTYGILIHVPFGSYIIILAEQPDHYISRALEARSKSRSFNPPLTESASNQRFCRGRTEPH